MKGISEFLQWWLSELRSLLPRRLRAERERGRTLLLEADSNEVRAAWIDGEAREPLLSVPRGAPVTDGPLAEHARRAARGEARVVARIAASEVLTRPVDLPAAAAENLREVIAFELHRLTPFRAEDVHFEHRRLGTSKGGQSLSVELRIVRRAVIDELCALLAPQRFEPRGEAALEDAGAGALCLRLMPAHGDAPRTSWVGRTLWAFNAALLAAVLMLPLARMETHIEGLRAQVAAARERADAVAALRDEADAIALRRDTVLSLKRETVPRIEILRELTERLPDSAWLHRFEIDGDEVVVQGSAEAASLLIASVEESPLFLSPTFPSPVVRNAATGDDRFRLAFRVAPAGP
jgi:general secretion pathway protein L